MQVGKTKPGPLKGIHVWLLQVARPSPVWWGFTNTHECTVYDCPKFVRRPLQGWTQSRIVQDNPRFGPLSRSSQIFPGYTGVSVLIERPLQWDHPLLRDHSVKLEVQFFPLYSISNERPHVLKDYERQPFVWWKEQLHVYKHDTWDWKICCYK